MKTSISLIFFFIVTVCSAQDQKNVSTSSQTKTTFNDAAVAFSNKAIADFVPMHDKQVNEILRICNKGQDIPGSVNALINLGVYLGSDLDLDEEDVIIRGSKVDVALYNNICKSIITSFSKPLTSSITEAENIIKAIEESKGQDILTGIKILAGVKYRMRRGPELIVTPDQLNLWASIGKLPEKDFQLVYKTLLSVGLDAELNYVSASSIMELLIRNKADDIANVTEVLSATGWRGEGEFDQRELLIIEKIINNKFEDTPTPVNILTNVSLTPEK